MPNYTADVCVIPSGLEDDRTAGRFCPMDRDPGCRMHDAVCR